MTSTPRLVAALSVLAAAVLIAGCGSAGTATFETDETKICTMDMAPRATLLSFGETEVEDDDFTLTLVGGGLDGTVPVRG